MRRAPCVRDELPTARVDSRPEHLEKDAGLGEAELMRLAGPLGIGALLLLLLAFSFSWTWFHRSGSRGSVGVSGLGTANGVALDENFSRQGQIHLGLSVALAIMVVIGYVVACSAPKWKAALAGKILCGLVLTAAAWGTLNAVRMAGFLWTTFSHPQTFPGLGLWLGLALSLGIGALFVTTALRWERVVWLVISQQTAGLVGWWELSVEPALQPAQAVSCGRSSSS